MKSKISKTSLTVAIAAMVVLAVAGSALAGGKAKTKVTIKEQSDGFYGYVKSGDKSCEISRIVVILKQKGGSPDPGHDKLISTDVAQANGGKYMWSISSNAKGRIYAYAPKISGCKAGRSKSV